MLIKFFNKFNKLTLLHKIFIIFLILLFSCFVVNKDIFIENITENFEDENDDNQFNKKFKINYNNDCYDQYYCKFYDKIYLNKSRNNYEVNIIKELLNKKNNTILDIGSGTGHHVNSLNSIDNVEVTGLDKSQAMIIKAKSNFPDCKFNNGDILNYKDFDYNSFSHILCLGLTFYHIQDKSQFFEICYNLLNFNGKLLLHLVDHENFEPYIIQNDNTILYNPNKYIKKKITQMIVKIDNDNEFYTKYELINKNKKDDLNKDLPYSMYNEKFENFKTNHVRKNEINLFMSPIDEILKLAEDKGFEFKKLYSMDEIDHFNQFLYCFIKK
jgi:ubiquinone/menaquinone biosynthesis C-methylase UbiE